MISRAGYAGLIAAGHHQLQEPSAHSRRAVWWHGQPEQVPMLITGRGQPAGGSRANTRRSVWLPLSGEDAAVPRRIDGLCEL